MSFERQCYWFCSDPLEGLNGADEFFMVYYLFRIFKELNPRLFKRQSMGRPRIYTPEIMLPFVCWGHMNGIVSCRDLEKWWKRNDDTCNVLLDCKRPGKSSINEFLNKFGDLVDAFDVFIVEFGLRTGLMAGDVQYVDGTFLGGYCNDFKRLYRDQLYYLKDFILKFSGDRGDDGLWFKLKIHFEDEESGDERNAIVEDLKKAVGSSGVHLLKRALRGDDCLEEVMLRINLMEDNLRRNSPVSVVDPEACSMLDKANVWGFNYNYQVAVDGRFGLISAHYVTQNSNDRRELLAMVGLLNERLGRDEYVVCADNGYWHIESLHKLDSSPVAVVIPDHRAASKRKADLRKVNDSGYYYHLSPFDVEREQFRFYNFSYYGDEDVFIGPYGCRLSNSGKTRFKYGIGYRAYSTDECKACFHRVFCVAGRSRREILVRDDSVLDRVNSVYCSSWGQKIYSGRGWNVEGAFGVLLESRNFRGIKTRGLKRVGDEMTLCVITHNLKKVHRHMGVGVLKRILSEIHRVKKGGKRVDMGIFDNWEGRFIMEDDVIVDVEI